MEEVYEKPFQVVIILRAKSLMHKFIFLVC